MRTVTRVQLSGYVRHVSLYIVYYIYIVYIQYKHVFVHERTHTHIYVYKYA